MSKTEFLELLKEKGYNIQSTEDNIPTVLCNNSPISIAFEVKKLAEENGYIQSFGVARQYDKNQEVPFLS